MIGMVNIAQHEKKPSTFVFKHMNPLSKEIKCKHFFLIIPKQPKTQIQLPISKNFKQIVCRLICIQFNFYLKINKISSTHPIIFNNPNSTNI